MVDWHTQYNHVVAIQYEYNDKSVTCAEMIKQLSLLTDIYPKMAIAKKTGTIISFNHHIKELILQI